MVTGISSFVTPPLVAGLPSACAQTSAVRRTELICLPSQLSRTKPAPSAGARTFFSLSICFHPPCSSSNFRIPFWPDSHDP